MSQYTPRKFTLPADYRFEGDADFAVEPYIFSEAVVIAVDVALATGRPLLVAGPPGCGKSRLADAMAAILGWNFLHETVTSRTRLEGLTVEVDHLRRLHDAHCAAIPRQPQAAPEAAPHALKPDAAYYNPGIFWWAFHRKSASRRNLSEAAAAMHGIDLGFPGIARIKPEDRQNTVLLIDEIDKAEPDLPNDLLEPLDRRSFPLPDGSTLAAVAKQQLLTVITTNREREMPKAFLRRCVTLLLERPAKPALLAIGKAHYPDADPQRMATIADKILAFQDEAEKEGSRAPGTSEFLDAIDACEKLGVEMESEVWKHVERAVLLKPTDPEHDHFREA